ncbi:LLM class flavin-dependent oxidoreductase [Nocardioides lianchengensis]|uniref:LLM class flavin-dependent oxidoreductase n=1 Tax=Nocardioides lianchengensis TaxID=1045774 RepID=UPI000B80F6DB|nr:LLM class flavin-dependent oxidoreductase [Nocardioides lianchengensis]NYG08988.1 alkanesulfonate monooxygenase SsuD/methylene tetrahydromethanopterin reductase-like flavin-dependent oxidoreductase (luciferase family) [Nocardioides lianchengensis]
MRSPVEIGLVDLFDGSEERDVAFMAEFGRTAEELGFSGIWLPEHLVFFDEYTSAYPYPNAPSASDPDKLETHNKSVGGRARVEAAADQGLLDILQAAAEVCAATTRLRVGSSVLLLPLRNVRTFTRELMTLAELTDDRFDLGVGVGWSAEEFGACGSPFKTRGRRCEQNMVELARQWAEDADGLYPQTGRALPRMLVGGHSPVALRRAATAGTGWYPWNLTVSQFGEHHATYLRHLEEAGRDRAEQHVVAGLRFTGELTALPDVVGRYAELGADGVNLSLRMTAESYAETMSAVSDAVGLAA